MSLRHLVACPACGLQFDASGREAGSCFRCACGEVVEVAAARPQDAAVVRCSSCGAPRQGGAEACGFCGADFTLHERDLHTLCPECMTRISDRGRFCHACGVAIAPQGPVGEETGFACPACGEERRLASRGLGDERVTVLECGRCAGLWLGREVFRVLEERALRVEAAEEPPAGRTPVSRPRNPDPAVVRQVPTYRPCPMCGKLMHRRNYGRKSGVIVDTCGSDGIWFDRGELESVLGWLKSGGSRRAERERRLELEERERGRRLTQALEPLPHERGRAASWGELIGRLIDVLAG